jgi:hypothetical protein
MSEGYEFPVDHYPAILDLCISDAKFRYKGEQLVTDVRLWNQKWPDHQGNYLISPTIVVKFSRHLRIVYHRGVYSYELKGQTTVKYYDAVRARKLPGADDPEKSYLVTGSE